MIENKQELTIFRLTNETPIRELKRLARVLFYDLDTAEWFIEVGISTPRLNNVVENYTYGISLGEAIIVNTKDQTLFLVEECSDIPSFIVEHKNEVEELVEWLKAKGIQSQHEKNSLVVENVRIHLPHPPYIVNVADNSVQIERATVLMGDE